MIGNRGRGGKEKRERKREREIGGMEANKSKRGMAL